MKGLSKMNDELRQFNIHWQNFITQYKGRLSLGSKAQKITFGYVKIQLDDIMSMWSSSDTEAGKWLEKYNAVNPQKGKLLRKILLEDIKLEEIEENGSSDILAYIAPVAGAALGYSISFALGAETLVKAASSILPAALIYPISKNVCENAKKTREERLIEEYTAQLDKYRQSVASVISN